MLNEFVYCPRLFYLEWVQGDWAESEDTLEGASVHRRVEQETGRLPAPEELESQDRVSARSVLLSAPTLGLVARMDLLEGEAGAVRPVDYKKGSPGPRGPWEPELVQLCAQGLVLRENGYRCDEGVLYYASPKRRFAVPFDDDLIRRTEAFLVGLRETALAPIPPPRLVDSPKCPRCSLVGICLPDEVSLLRGEPLDEVRRLVPARDDAAPLYAQEQGASVGRSKERLVVRRRDEDDVPVRLLDVSQVSVYGNVQVTAQAIRGLAEREIPIFHHTYGGWLAAVTTGIHQRNVELRVQQYQVADDEDRALPLARAFVVGKLRNQRTLLRRNTSETPRAALTELTRMARLAQEAPSRDRLFGLEGMGARAYFAHFAEMLRDPMGFDLSGRERRPPPDPVNALLSFLYGLLVLRQGTRGFTLRRSPFLPATWPGVLREFRRAGLGHDPRPHGYGQTTGRRRWRSRRSAGPEGRPANPDPGVGDGASRGPRREPGRQCSRALRQRRRLIGRWVGGRFQIVLSSAVADDIRRVFGYRESRNVDRRVGFWVAARPPLPATGSPMNAPGVLTLDRSKRRSTEEGQS